MMIGGLGIIRGQESGGSQTKVAPFWMDRYPSEIGDEMSAIENEAWVEAVALATLNDLRVSGGWPPLIEIPEGFQDADEWRAQARAAIRALLPLIIEQCAEVARHHADAHARSLGAYGAADVDHGRGRQEGHIDAGNAIAQGILALNHFGDATEMVVVQTKEADHA